MKSKVTTIGVLFLAASAAFGAVSINFSDDFSSGVPEGLSNALGVPTNGLNWGIVVDTTGNGLSLTPYNVPSFASGSQTLLTLAAGGNSDDVFYASTSGLTQSTISNFEGDGATTGGDGGFYDVANIGFSLGTTAGKKFYVVWFDGALGGTLTDPTFVIPSDGAAITYGLPFVGVDPARRAGLAYVGTDPVSTGVGMSLIPEPSAALLGALGALGLLRRRRN